MDWVIKLERPRETRDFNFTKLSNCSAAEPFIVSFDSGPNSLFSLDPQAFTEECLTDPTRLAVFLH